MIYALDSNIIIRYLRNDKTVLKNFDTAATHGDTLIVSKMVDYEVKRGFRIVNAPAKESAYMVLTEPAGRCEIEDMDSRSWKQAEKIYAELYQKDFTIGELDILIAAHCLVNGYTLVTHNTKHFKDIEGLQMVDWAE